MKPAKILYIVATPIGNLQDITARALQVLQEVDFIAAEDTRHSKQLLNHYAITTPMLALHEHNEFHMADKLIERLVSGETAALISDAGTPLISDPGYHLVHKALQAGIKIIPLPGPSALICALSAAGFAADRFIFEGFLPPKSTARCQRLQALINEERTLVFYESPHRILESLTDMKNILGATRLIVLARELTKTFETIYRGTLEELFNFVANDENQRRGEFVLVVKGAEKLPDEEMNAEAERILTILLAELPTKQAVSLAAKITGLRKNQLYKQSLL